MKKKIIFISESIPHNGFGSFTIFFRHLRRFSQDGHEISVIIPEYKHINSNDYIKEYPENWNVIKLPLRKWYYLPYRFQNTILRDIRYNQMFNMIKHSLSIDQNTLIISYFYLQCYNGFAVWLKQKFKCKLGTFLHDDKYLLGAKSKTLKYDQFLAKNASIIWTVSDSLKIPNTEECSYQRIYPIPEGFKYNSYNKRCLSIGFSGTLYRNYMDEFRKILDALIKVNGEFHLIASIEKNEWLRELLKEYKNLIIIPLFPKSEDALRYLHEHCNCLYCGYPLKEKNMEWIRTSFPSKFIEYSFLNLPIILSAPQNTALYKWSKEKDWPLFFNSTEELQNIIVKINQNWHYYSQITSTFVQKEFSPENIHNSLLNHV